jgi:splicing factor, arginine/serine-rich 4/5/6
VSGIGLPTDARSDDVSKFFEGYGRIIDCRVMTGSFQPKMLQTLKIKNATTGFGFVEFENAKASCLPSLT